MSIMLKQTFKVSTIYIYYLKKVIGKPPYQIIDCSNVVSFLLTLLFNNIIFTQNL